MENARHSSTPASVVDALAIFGQSVVGEDFVGDQRDIALRAESR